MPRERKRKANEPIQKGIPIAEPGSEVIFNDPVLKSPFISNPFISRLKGRAFLEQSLAYNLYFDDLTQKWKPLSDISISTVKNLGRYYPSDPTPPTNISDLPLRINNMHELMVNDEVLITSSDIIRIRLDSILTKNTLIESHLDMIKTTLNSIESCFLGQNLAEERTYENVYTKILTAYIDKYADKFSASWLIAAPGSGDAYAKVYVNDVAVGTEKMTPTGVPSFRIDKISVPISVGDAIQLYGYNSQGPTYSCEVSNFILYGK